MSFHHAPDIHTGRCQNLRHDPGDPYRTTLRRCLRMDGHGEACRFPDPKPRYDTMASNITPNVLVPKAWVEPEERPADGARRNAVTNAKMDRALHLYQTAKMEGQVNPLQVVADEMDIARSTAFNYVKAARSR